MTDFYDEYVGIKGLMGLKSALTVKPSLGRVTEYRNKTLVCKGLSSNRQTVLPTGGETGDRSSPAESY